MGQAGAQREPSMEEILASIRRIIENNEPAQAETGDESDAPEVAASAEYDDRFPESEPVPAPPDVAANEPGDEPAAEPVSLADVAARVRGSAPASSENHDAAIDKRAAEELHAALVSDEPVSATPAAAENSDPWRGSASNDAAKAHEHTGTQLISAQTGEKVAAAFDELGAAVIAGANRSFEEIAEDMLRPMLTQWLDDNLPTLVERLVREEIERVARGNRR